MHIWKEDVKYRVYDFVYKRYSDWSNTHRGAYDTAIVLIDKHLKEQGLKPCDLALNTHQLIAGSWKLNDVTYKKWSELLGIKHYIKQMVIILDNYGRIYSIDKLDCLRKDPANGIYYLKSKTEANRIIRWHSTDWNIKHYKANYLGFRNGPIPMIHKCTGHYSRRMSYKHTLLNVDLTAEDKAEFEEYNIKINKGSAVDARDIEPTEHIDRCWKSQRKARKQWQRDKRYLTGEKTIKLSKALANVEMLCG